MQITLSGKLMQVTPPLNVLDRDTLPYVYIFIRYRHCVHELRRHRLKLLISTLMKIGNIFQVSRPFKIKELSESFYYDHSLLYSESWTNILHSHSLSINLGNRHYFNSLPELDCQLRKNYFVHSSLKTRTKENKIW